VQTPPFLSSLAGLPLGPLRWFEQIDSTNNAAASWADDGAPDLALVVADEQTAGRGRQGRRWFTPPGAALAFSLVLRPELTPVEYQEQIGRLTALGALAVCGALRRGYQIPAQIKWPNDVLIARRKVCGILAEAHWQADRLDAIILGVGVNIAPESVPAEGELIFPATCVQDAASQPLMRWELLRAILEELLEWRSKMHTAQFWQAWEEWLAFKGEWVYIYDRIQPGNQVVQRGQIIGLDENGYLLLNDPQGQPFKVIAGDVRLRPGD
jgi:BirA family transcriptional regulator, biotin operon repressor / biotin---[acetyl-CoA-carboxylase] ligase